VFRCAGDDEWVAVAVTSQSEWEALARAIGRADWLEDDRLRTLPERRRQADELEAGIEEWSSSLSAREAESVLREAGVPAAKSQSNRDLLEDDAHLRERGYYWTLDHPVVGPSSYDGAPFKLSETPAEGHRPAPLLGQHTLEVYREVGFGDEEIAEFVTLGVISA
jgi:benzylsuccinate CoA-transferase BbsF subunit